MTIKIKAPRATIKWAAFCDAELIDHDSLSGLVRPGTKTKARIVRESDWRKLMKLVKAAEVYEHAYPSEVCGICEALAALEKKK